MPHQEPLHPAIEQLVKDTASFPVRRILLFGSRARGDALPRADVDIAVDAPELTGQQWNAILEAVEKAPTLLKIDCVWLQKQDGKFLDAILRDGRILYERKE